MLPAVSLVVIVKNDAERIVRCLKSVKDVVNEMVVLDTGSTDGTQDRARELGAKVTEIEWPGRFDVALNHALELASGKWILRLDSDEWFDPEDAAQIPGLVDSNEFDLYYLTRIDYMEVGSPLELDIVRLWKASPDLRYRGIVHENLVSDPIRKLMDAGRVCHCGLRLHHDGYVRPTEDKTSRNRRLLEARLAETPEDLYARVAMLELRTANREAVQHDVDALADQLVGAPDAPPEFPALLWVIACSIEGLSDKDIWSKRADQLVQYALRHGSRSPIALWPVAQLYAKRRCWHQAWQLTETVEWMGRTGLYERGAPVYRDLVEQGGPALRNAIEQEMRREGITIPGRIS